MGRRGWYDATWNIGKGSMCARRTLFSSSNETIKKRWENVDSNTKWIKTGWEKAINSIPGEDALWTVSEGIFPPPRLGLCLFWTKRWKKKTDFGCFGDNIYGRCGLGSVGGSWKKSRKGVCSKPEVEVHAGMGGVQTSYIFPKPCLAGIKKAKQKHLKILD